MREQAQRRERELKHKANQNVPMRSRSISPQKGSYEDEEDLDFLDEVVIKVKDTFRRAKHKGQSS